jgi:hypothetical protein
MVLSAYPVLCTATGCTQPAVFKIAACWSDGYTHELKTYALACRECLAQLYAAARIKQAQCRLAPAEVLEAPGIYELERGVRDRMLQRRKDLERQLESPTAS